MEYHSHDVSKARKEMGLAPVVKAGLQGGRAPETTAHSGLTKTQKLFIEVLKWCWWAGVFYIPILLGNMSADLYMELGCPPGDCYLPGTNTAFNLDLVASLLGVVLWPPCVWHMGLKQLNAWPKGRWI